MKNMDGEISSLNERTILAQHGPMTLTIQAWDRNGPDIGLAARAGESAFGIQPRIAPARALFRGRRRASRQPDSYPTRPFAAAALAA